MGWAMLMVLLRFAWERNFRALRFLLTLPLRIFLLLTRKVCEVLLDIPARERAAVWASHKYILCEV
jgi:hypothetical protein